MTNKKQANDPFFSVSHYHIRKNNIVFSFPYSQYTLHWCMYFKLRVHRQINSRLGEDIKSRYRNKKNSSNSNICNIINVCMLHTCEHLQKNRKKMKWGR